MAGTTPNSTIRLYDIPDSDVTAGTVFLFDSEADREKFFGNYLVAQDVKCTVIKKSYQTLKISIPLATAERCNYISFRNPDFGDKIFYGVILNVDYLNNNTVVVNYEVDWWYTDMFNVKAQVSQMVREGLANREYPTEMMTDGGKYFDNNEFIEKMTSPEPLACDTSTEEEHYQFYMPGDTNDYSCGMMQVIRDTNPRAYSVLGKNLTGICFVCPDFDKLDHEGDVPNQFGYTRAFERIIKSIRSTSNYYVKVPFNEASSMDPNFGTVYRWDAFFCDPDTDQLYPGTDYDTTGYSLLTSGENQLTGRYIDFNAIGSEMKSAYCIVIAQNSYINRIISFLNSLDMSSNILGVHMITDEIFAMLCGDEINYNNQQLILTRNKCSQGMYFPQTRLKKKSSLTSSISPKLMFYPYSYMTLSTNDGKNNMEYRYEYMVYNKDDSGHDFAIHMFAKYDSDGPAVICAPEGYRQRYATYETGIPSPHYQYTTYEINPDDSIGDSNYPQVPYTTDAWLANIASKSNELIKQNTTEFKNSIGAEYSRGIVAEEVAGIQKDTALWGGVFDTIGNALTLDVGGAIGSAAGAYTGSMTAAAEYQAKQLENANIRLRANMHDNAYSAKGVAAGILRGNPVYENYKYTIAAYAQPNYHSGTALRPGMINGVGEKFIYAVYHQLRWPIFLMYNEFFKRFGYTTKQLKIPAIFEQLYSASGTGMGQYLKPHFESVKFYDFRTKGHTTPTSSNGYDRDVFYTQTDGLKLTGVNKTSEEFIRRLFDAGCLFIRPIVAELATPVEPTPTPITPAPYVPPTPVPTPTPTPTPVASLTFITNPKDMVFDSSNSVWIINQSSYAEGGTTPYTYAWKIKLSNNEIIDLGINSSVCAFAITSRDTLMSYDGAELYNTVTDADGNTADSDKATITVVSPEPPEPTPTEPTPTEPTPTEPTPTEPTPTPTGVEFTTVSIDASSGARSVAVIRASVSGVDYSTDKYYSDMYFPGVGSNPGYWINGSYAMTFYSFYNYECRATQYCSPSEVVSKVRLRIEKDGNTYTSDEYIIDRTITWDTPVVATPAGAASNIKAVTVSNIANVSDGATIQFVGKPVGGENFTQVYSPVTITGGSATSGNIDTDNVESVCFVIVNGNNFVGSGEITLT